MASNPDALIKRPLYVYDLPPELLASLQLKAASAPPAAANDHSDSPSSEQDRSASPSQNGTASKSFSCASCNLSFANLQEQRNHARSDLHRYNLKQKVKGHPPVSEAAFEELVGDLDESISGSDTTGSDTDSDREGQTGASKDSSTLSNLLKRQAKIAEPASDDFASQKKQRGPGKPPLYWFTSPLLPQNTSLGIYRAVFSNLEQEEEEHMVDSLRKKQLPLPDHSKPPDDGGVRLPSTQTSPHIFLCMIGGGHFAGMIVSLAPKVTKKAGQDERQASVLAHKTFHRYTTRRKQGGAQSANDAKGAAQSAGASLRRHNEAALTNEVRELLAEWKPMIDAADLVFVRASGSTNRRTLFGPYDGQILRHNDPRNRGFPFSTRRATQAELMRCFVELTRVKVSHVDEAALLAATTASAATSTTTTTAKPTAPSKPTRDPEEEAALLHTSQIESLVRRSKAPALLSYLTTHSLPPDYRLHPPDSQAHHHAPTPLHAAAAANAAALVSALLGRAGADPTLRSAQGRTAFEVAGDRPTRDAFRIARKELGEARWDWDGAGVPEGLSREEVDVRGEREREEQGRQEKERREGELARLREEERAKEETRREGRVGKGKTLGQVVANEMTAEEKREQDTRGMTEEMKRRLEREKRARAAEERMRRLAGGS